MESTRRRTSDLREVAWQVLLAAGAGAIVGAVVGGIGGRLVMLALRLASADSVRGVVTDDGFEIGQITTETGFLLTVAAGLGGATGLAYLVLRSALPHRGRAAVWGVFVALLVGADVLKPGSLDFTLLDPKSLSVVGFVLLPGLAAFLIALVVERLLIVEPWSNRLLVAGLGLGALPLVPVLPAVALLGGVMVVLRRVPRLGVAVRATGRVAVPVLVAGLAVKSGVELWRDAGDILS